MAPTRRIGSLDVSLAGLGCGNFGFFSDESQSTAVVHAALDLGITHFDVADVYGEGLAETFLGRALGRRRSEVVITTKFGSSSPPGGPRPGSAAWAKRACEASLQRLGTDWVDLLLLHQPDPGNPIVETLQALGELRTQGKVREIGCSNFDAEQLEEAAAAAASLGIAGFVTVQNSYSLLDRTAEAALLPTMERLGVSLLPYMPLASGMLTGKYRRDSRRTEEGRLARELRGATVRDYFPALLTDGCFDVVEALERYARLHGRSLVELALSWLASKPYVASVIAGAQSPEQLRQNLAAMDAWPLSPADLREVERIAPDDVSFPWNAGFPSYARLPPGIERGYAPDIRERAPVSPEAARPAP